MPEIYPYDTRRKLNNPKPYSYAPYVGSDFFQAYFQKRRGCLEELARNADECSFTRSCLLFSTLHDPDRPSPRFAPADAGLTEAAFVFSPEAKEDQKAYFSRLDREERIETKRLALGLLSAFCKPDRTLLAQASPWAGVLAARFDITGNLYETYGPGLRKGEGRANLPAILSSAALAVAGFACREGGLKALNALLKINDRVCAESDLYRDRETSGAAHAALLLETKLIRRLLSHEGGA